MIKAQTADLAFRVKSGWAAVVLLTDIAHPAVSAQSKSSAALAALFALR